MWYVSSKKLFLSSMLLFSFFAAPKAIAALSDEAPSGGTTLYPGGTSGGPNGNHASSPSVVLANQDPAKDWEIVPDLNALFKFNHRIDGGPEKQHITWKQAYAWATLIKKLDATVIDPVEEILCNDDPLEPNRSVLLIGEDSPLLVKLIFARLAARADEFASKKGPEYKPCHSRVDADVDITAIEAGHSYVGQTSGYLVDNIIKPAAQKAAVLYFNDLGHLIGLGSHSNNSQGVEADLADYIQAGAIKVVAFANTGTAQSKLDSDRGARLRHAFAREIQLPKVEKELLAEIVKSYIQIHPTLKDKLVDEDVSYLEEIGQRYFFNTPEPERSISVLRHLILRSKDKVNPLPAPIFSRANLRLAVGQVGNVPSWIMEQNWSRIKDLDDKLIKKLIGQEVPREQVVRLAEAGYSVESPKQRPIAKLIFAGPTGTGKTYLAEKLAKYLDLPLVTIYMTDYTMGYNADEAFLDTLTKKLRETPWGVYDFEEFDKASDTVRKKLYDFLDEGKIRDLSGKEYSSAGTFVIAPTNAGEHTIHDHRNEANLQALVEEELRQKFGDALLNRFDRVSIFRNFTSEEFVRLYGVMMKEVQDDFAAHQKWKVVVTDEVKKYIIDHGQSDLMGARPMQRTIDSVVNYGIGDYQVREKGLPLEPITIQISLKNASRRIFTVTPQGMKPHDFVPEEDANGNRLNMTGGTFNPNLGSETEPTPQPK